MVTPPHTSPRLEALLIDARGLDGADLLARMTWLEAVADAVDEASLGSLGKGAARDFRAALGAIIAFSRGSRDPDELDALHATVRTFMARAQQALFGALSSSYRELAASAQGEDRAECAAIAQAFAEMRDAVTSGGPAPQGAIDRLAMIGARRAAPPKKKR